MMDDVTSNSTSASEKSFDTEKLLVELLKILKDEKMFDTTGEFPVVEFLHPHQLQKKIDLKLKDEGCDDSEIKTLVRKFAQSIILRS
ncbi:GSCOCG00000497001-RA-CDS [Cotesia congregata]|nr:GSCOCG00000497001-RA-CDS [Cotesia congregata]